MAVGGKTEKTHCAADWRATGVGKSTVATILATRLNITKVASSDAIKSCVNSFR